jgi:magnesium transporter
LVGAVTGAILAMLILIGSRIFDLESRFVSPGRIAGVVTTIAAMVGAFVPMALDRISIDPAAVTGVFITTSNDVLGVLVFFILATQFYFD